MNGTLPAGKAEIRSRAMLLLKFFEEIFRPLQLRNRSPAYQAFFRSAINALRKTLKRAPTLDDLNREAIQAVAENMAAGNLGVNRINQVHKHLVQLWRYAHH
ncbi:MAG: hypothetical protein NTY19_08265, partial [Planctomycetota bacterium]|nr:hypothetical protein [Planctomycetota bacterium]